MSAKLSIEKPKRLLTSGKRPVRKGWFGSKARNHVAFTLHCGDSKPVKLRAR